jgi:hypothetical protein
MVVYRQYARDENGKLVRTVEQKFGVDEIDEIRDICYKLPQPTEYAPMPAQQTEGYEAQVA